MTALAPLKKSPCMKEWMIQVDPSKEAITVKKWMTPFFKQNDTLLYRMDGSKQCFEKNIMSLEKFDASSRSS